ncbi:MAG: lipopolysaccharide biosynthesis protein [Verrucomicrobiales bacterium]
MTNEDVKRSIYRNSISNYVFLVLRLGLGLVLFRLIFQSLSKEEFGFWALMWSVFGYGILLDFGFGFTAQKRVAELSVHQKWEELSKVLSTIFFVYLGIAVVLMLVGTLGAPLIIQIFKVTEANRQYFMEIITIFFVGMGFAFPMGIFPEMLRGQQRISLANYTLLGGYLASFVMTVLCLKYGWGLKALFVISLSGSILSELACGLFALGKMPQVKIRPKFFSRDMIRSTMRFSVYAYIATLSTIILTRTDHLVLSSVLAVSAVAIYQAGAKVGEMFTSFALQIPETLSPAAAHLHAKGDKEFLRTLLINGTRFSVMIATPLYLICAFYMSEILRLLTGEAKVHFETFWVGQVLLFWGYTTILTQSTSKRIFMMTGHEKRLMWLGVGEALLNLGLSIALVLHYRNVLCVAIGSLVATFIFGWFYIWPWAAREANLSPWRLARAVLLPTWVSCLPLLGIILLERYFDLPGYTNSFTVLVFESILAFAVAGICLWHFALKADERAKFTSFFSKFLNKGAA